MAADLWRRLLWQVVGIICYLGGLVLFLVVAVDVYTAPPEGSFENLSLHHLALIGASVVLMVASGGILFAHRNVPIGMIGPHHGVGGTRDSPGSRRSEDPLDQFPTDPPDDPQPSQPDSGPGVRCPTCGVTNEEGYRFCRSCSSDLSR